LEKLLDKLSSYNILNNLIPGSIFCYLLRYVNGIDLLSDSVIENLFIYYFIGMVISRFGSLLVEPIAIKTGLVNYVDYTDYLLACKTDGKIDTLLETNNLYRTMSASGLLIIITSVYLFVEQQISSLSDATPYLVAIFLLLLFLLSFRKQSTYIKKRVEHVVQNKREEA
jgi:hypothetical protein